MKIICIPKIGVLQYFPGCMCIGTRWISVSATIFELQGRSGKYCSPQPDTAVFRQISSCQKFPYVQNLAQRFSVKSLKSLPPEVKISNLTI